jgi:group I intron endonuclease
VFYVLSLSSSIPEVNMKRQVIYKIVNTTNAKFYVGSTTNLKERTRAHRKMLRAGTHHCKHLQAAWKRYGEGVFVFLVVQDVSQGESLRAAEDAWLQQWVGQDQCYNTGYFSAAPWRGVPPEAHPNYGRPVPEATAEKISTSLKEFFAANPDSHPRKGKRHDVETRQKISTSRKGKAAGQSHYRYGKEVAVDVREKIGAAQRGKPKQAGRQLSAAGKAKIAAAAAAGRYSHWLGRTHTEAAKAKMSRAVRVTSPAGESTTYPSITALREVLQLKPATVNRALKSGAPITKGRLVGYCFAYANSYTQLQGAPGA